MPLAATGPAWMFCPADRPERFEKAAAAADIVILDLEDAVSPDAKRDARQEIANALEQRDAYAWRELIVRVNGLDTPWGHSDLSAMARAGADAILLPKVEGSDTVRRALHVLDLAGAPAALGIWCMIETPRGVLRVEEIADTERVQCLVMGTSDLTKDLHAHHTKNRLPMLGSLETCLLAARAARSISRAGQNGTVQVILAGSEEQIELGERPPALGRTVHDQFALVHHLTVVHHDVLVLGNQELVDRAVRLGDHKTLLALGILAEGDGTGHLRQHAGILRCACLKQLSHAWQTAGNVAGLCRLLRNTRKHVAHGNLLTVLDGNERTHLERDGYRVLGTRDTNLLAGLSQQFDLRTHAL